MSVVNIPEEDIESLFSFSQLPEEAKNGVYETLALIRLGDHPKKIAKTLLEKFNVEYDDGYTFLIFYFSLLKAVHLSEIDDNEIISKIINSIGENNFDFDSEDLNEIENIIRKLINIKNEVPLITSLAFDSALSNNNLLLKSYVYEDLRPIFLNEKVAGLSLYHTLGIHFKKEDGSHSDLYFTIDKDDINNLLDQLTLAKNRADVIKEQYGNTIIEI